jgi:hypothetical protein
MDFLNRRQGLIAPAIILLAAALLFGGVWRHAAEGQSRCSDIVAQHHATKTVLWRNLQAGDGIPFWRSDQLSGTPALTHPQSLYTYPLHALYFFLPPERALGPTLWLHLAAAGLVLWALGGALGLGHAARLIMGLAGLFNFKLLAIHFSGWLPVIPGVVFVPLLMAAVLYLLEKPGLPAMLLVALSGALCLHTGHLQLFYYAVLFLSAYVLLRCALAWRADRRREAGRTLALLAAASLLAAGLTAYLLWPMAAEAPLMSRGEAGYDFFLGRHSLKPLHLAGFLCPLFVTDKPEFWEDVAYFGLIPLALAAAGALLARRRRPVLFLTVGFVLSVALAADTPLLRAAHDYVPGFALFRCPNRLLFLTAIFGIALAGFGLEELLARARKRAAWPWLTVAVVAPLALVMAIEARWYAGRLLPLAPTPEGQRVDLAPRTDYQRFLADRPGTYRVAPFGRSTLNYGWAASMGVEMPTGFDAYNFRHYQDYMDLLRHGKPGSGGARVWTDLEGVQRWDLLSALNVRYLLSPRPPPSPEFAKSTLFAAQPAFAFYKGMTTSDVHVIENPFARERAFWCPVMIGARTEAEMRDLVAGHRLGRSVVVLGLKSDGTSTPAPMQAGVNVLDARDGFLRLELDTPGDERCFLVISEVWHPGWQARLDGRPVDLHRTEIALMGLYVPPGRHTLTLLFRPLHWETALTVTAAAALALLLVAAWMFHTALRAHGLSR